MQDLGQCPVPRWKLLVKRAGDILVSLILLTAFSPLLLLMALIIRLTSKGPIFFVQERVGFMGKPFQMYKFRTMVEGAVSQGLGYDVTQDDARITSIGRLLRTTSLDEIPQLFNVLKGEMSLVGPRPTLTYQVEQYAPEQRRRLLVPPGITGLAQVSGRNLIPWSRRIELDLQYIDQYSLLLDLKICLRTILVLLGGKGVYRQS